jgi:RNA polymerase sigma-70 factor (ECF subfamily)
MASNWPDPDRTEELLREARNGDDGAINRLMERHRAAVHRLVQIRLDQRIQRRLDVSDVVQDVFVEANRRIQRYLANPLLPFHLWLRHIARDRIIDAHRRHRQSARRSVDREQPLVLPADCDHSTRELAGQLWDHQLTPEAAATQKELAVRIERGISQLNDQDAEIVLMRHYEHLSNQEIAQSLGLTEPAASMRYLRAIRRLRSMLLDELPPQPPAEEKP